MKNKFIILGSGSSLGSPWITNYWGRVNKKNNKNIRSRCCAYIKYKNLSILIDTSPDIKKQILDNEITNIDAILYTHNHADQTSGIFEMRPFFWKNKKKIPIYANKKTLTELKKNYTFCFKERYGYKPIMIPKNIRTNFSISKKNTKLTFKSFSITHGLIKATAYVFKGIAYLSDCNGISKKNYKYLQNLDLLILDCLRKAKHPSHFNYSDALKIINELKPKKAILTNLHTDFDYNKLKIKLPKNIVPAFDGLTINF